jgi:putative DNA-invertase from lambdoid prophage Rac
MSGLANARARGAVLGRQAGDNITVRKVEAKVLKLKAAGKSLRWIAKELKISRTTVTKALKLAQQANKVA